MSSLVPLPSCVHAFLQVLKVPSDLAYHGTGPMVSARVHDLSVLWRRTKQTFEACSRVSLVTMHIPSFLFTPCPVEQVCELVSGPPTYLSPFCLAGVNSLPPCLSLSLSLSVSLSLLPPPPLLLGRCATLPTYLCFV